MNDDATQRARNPRERGMTGIHSLDHFSLTVPDLDVAAAFYRRFGLDVRPAGDEFGLHTFESPHRWAQFRRGPTKALAYLSFGAYAEDMPVFRDRLERRGVATVAPPPNAVDDTGLWFHDDDGTLLEIRVAAKVSPDVKSSVSYPVTPEGVAAMPLRADATTVRPRRLSHILVFTSDVPRAIDFYRDTVGLGLSDASGDGIAFMHGIHGSDHHLVAFAKSDARGFHHCSWDVGSVNEVGLGAMQMADGGHIAGWGLGRHVLGSNFFHYVRDPWGSYSEYSHDIDYIPGDGRWKPSNVSAENGFYLWGPAPPADFAFNYESRSANLTRELVASEPG
jgi:catechol 2,3-dioxygenase-like lactoylglutathione lyase family enzyme